MARKDIVWVIEDDRSLRWVLEKSLLQADMTVRCFDSAIDIIEILDRQQPDVIITDIRMPRHGKMPPRSPGRYARS